MTITTAFPADHPATAFLRLAEQVRLLEGKHLAWALVLLTNPIPPHALDWAEVEVDPQGHRTLSYTVGHGSGMERRSRSLSQTAGSILLPGQGSLLRLLGADRVTASAVVQELEHALRDISGPETIAVATLYAAAVCVTVLDELPPGSKVHVSTDELVRRAGFGL